MNCFSIRAGLTLTLCLIGIAMCRAEVPAAHVNPFPLKVSVGYATDIRFAHISTAEGLSQIRVTNIVQDNLGFMWFGTLGWT